MPSLSEQYRPKTWDDVVGQSAAVAKLRRIGARGWGGRALWVSGVPGSGKTTIARIIASELAGPLAIREENAAEWGVDKVRDMAAWLTPTALPPRDRPELCGRAIILNEGHNMRDKVQAEFLTELEALKPHAAVIFTATAKGTASLFGEDQDGDRGALASRCIRVELETADYKLRSAFAARVREIAQREGLDGQPVAFYERMAERCRWNMRAMLAEVESGAALA